MPTLEQQMQRFVATPHKAIEYILKYGNMGGMTLINKKGKIVEISKREFKLGQYKKKIKGFL